MHRSKTPVKVYKDAVGTPITERPPHRTVRTAFLHTACMGLSLSRVHHAIFVARCYSILLFDPRREHSSIPTAHCRRRRAQWRSRTALLQRRRRLVLDGREHGGRLPVTRRPSAISSLRASATIIVVLRAPLGPSVRVRYHRASALSFWNIKKRHANWISPRRTRALPALARPFSRLFKPLSSGDPVSPA